MASFVYSYQNSSVCSFLMQIRVIVIETSLGLQNFNAKGERK